MFHFCFSFDYPPKCQYPCCWFSHGPRRGCEKLSWGERSLNHCLKSLCISLSTSDNSLIDPSMHLSSWQQFFISTTLQTPSLLVHASQWVYTNRLSYFMSYVLIFYLMEKPKLEAALWCLIHDSLVCVGESKMTLALTICSKSTTALTTIQV